ncbi:MAG: hypothetical protein CVV03_07180 [Firmicutes bacterium HGW-Firmicutes-8]|nr:MAG: hypothetical protein CVV03_07180 [Firmicutes bacterium HGW-Firmicutes-8]
MPQNQRGWLSAYGVSFVSLDPPLAEDTGRAAGPGVSPFCRNGGRQFYPLSIRARGSGNKMGTLELAEPPRDTDVPLGG